MSWHRDETTSISQLRGLPIQAATKPPVADEAERLYPGTRVGRYLILYPVGAGGMGEVYAAFDPQLDRKVAIKLALGEIDSRDRRRQRREGKTLARLRHPNVVAVHDVGEFQERLFIAMEFVDGPTLGEWLREDERPWREVVNVFLQAGRGLAAVHDAGLVHQDFKPGNAMIGADGEVRIVDFGLARGQDTRSVVNGLAKRSRPRGTPGYAAPERLDGHSADARSDQYSFCVALWRALYGRPPADDADDSRAGVPGWLQPALRRGLSEAPEDRYASMGKLLEALAPSRRSARRRRWIAAVGLLATGSLTAGLLALRPSTPALCAGAADHLQGIWDGDRQRVIRGAFGRAGSFGDEAFLALQPTLDAYARGWTSMHTEACEATHVRGEQSQRLLDLRMICLDDRLEEFRALIDVLASADRRVVVQGLPAATGLRSLSDCADRPELVLLNVPDFDARERAEVAGMRAIVETQIALYETGQESAASILVVEEVLGNLAELGGYPSLEARAFKLLGNLHDRHSPDRARARAAYQSALIAANASGDRNEQARVLALLASQTGYQQQDLDETRLWMKLAEASLAALGPGNEDTRFYVLRSLSNAAFVASDYEHAKALARRALGLGERRWGAESPKLLSLLNSLAITFDQGASSIESEVERSSLLERTLDIGAKAYGPSHPLLNPMLFTLGSSYANRGRYEQALALANRSLEMKQLARHSLAFPLLLRAHVMILLDRPAQARDDAQRAMTIIEQQFGNRHWLLARAYHSLGEIDLLELRVASARERFETARQVLVTVDPIRPDFEDYTIAFQKLSQGDVHLAQRKYEPARAALERARAAADARHPYRMHLDIHLGLGEALLGLGRYRQARPVLEHAIELGIPEADAVALGEARFLLARALWPEDRVTALDLAKAGRRQLARGESPRSHKLLSELDTWLTTPS